MMPLFFIEMPQLAAAAKLWRTAHPTQQQLIVHDDQAPISTYGIETAGEHGEILNSASHRAIPPMSLARGQSSFQNLAF